MKSAPLTGRRCFWELLLVAFEIFFVDPSADGVCYIHHICNIQTSDLCQELVGIILLETIVRDHPVNKVGNSDAGGILHGFGAADGHDSGIALNAGPLKGLPALNYFKGNCNICGNLQCNSADLSLAWAA